MELINQEHNIFNKPSLLVNLAHNLDISVNALKIYNFIVRELFKRDIKNNSCVITSYSAIAKNLGYSGKYSNDKILENLNELVDCKIHTKVFNKNRNDWEDNLITHLLSSIRYNKAEQKLFCYIDLELRDLILKYHNTFAKLDLVEMKTIKSRHTLKLYELFKDYSYHKNHKLKLSVADIQGFLNVPQGSIYRKTISVFNRDVLKKAIEEINKKTNMNVSFEYFRKSKKNDITYYIFKIKDINRYSFSLFKETMINYCQKVNLNLTFTYKKQEYYLEEIERKNSINYSTTNSFNVMFLDKNGKTVQTEKAKEIWQELFYQANYNTVDFFKELNEDIETFQNLYDTIKNKKILSK